MRLVKTSGEWVWHKHDETDELFLILEGEFDMDFRDRTVTVKPGELLIVPKGTEHRPAARRGEVKLLLIDPNDTPNTGDDATATKAVELWGVQLDPISLSSELVEGLSLSFWTYISTAVAAICTSGIPMNRRRMDQHDGA